MVTKDHTAFKMRNMMLLLVLRRHQHIYTTLQKDLAALQTRCSFLPVRAAPLFPIPSQGREAPTPFSNNLVTGQNSSMTHHRLPTSREFILTMRSYCFSGNSSHNGTSHNLRAQHLISLHVIVLGTRCNVENVSTSWSNC